MKPAITVVSKKHFLLRNDINSTLFSKDFEESKYNENEIEDYIFNFLDNNRVFYFTTAEEDKINFFFDVFIFNCELMIKYNNLDMIPYL